MGLASASVVLMFQKVRYNNTALFLSHFRFIFHFDCLSILSILSLFSYNSLLLFTFLSHCSFLSPLSVFNFLCSVDEVKIVQLSNNKRTHQETVCSLLSSLSSAPPCSPLLSLCLHKNILFWVSSLSLR
jgi:hypothetical protein